MIYDKNDISKGVYVNKTNESRKGDIFHYWYFLDKVFRFQTYVHNVAMIF